MDVSHNVPTPKAFEIKDLRTAASQRPDDPGTAGVRFPDTALQSSPYCVSLR